MDFLFRSTGNIISKHNWSLNSRKATGGKFVVMPMYHLLPLQTKFEEKKKMTKKLTMQAILHMPRLMFTVGVESYSSKKPQDAD